MLILARHSDERVIIRVPPSNATQEIVITLVGMRKDNHGNGFSVRLGFDAPRGVTVDREEVRRSKDEEGQR